MIRTLREWPAEVWFLVAAGVAVFVLLVGPASLDLSDPPVEDGIVRFRPGEAARDPAFSFEGDWAMDGADAVAKGRATIEFETPAGPWESARVRLRGDSFADWVVRFSRDFQSLSLPQVRPGEDVVIDPDSLPGSAFTGSPLRVRLSIQPGEGLAPRLRLVTLELLARPPAAHPGHVAGLVSGLFFPAALALFLSVAGRRTLRQGAVLGAIAGGAAGLFAHYQSTVFDYLLVGTPSLLLGAATGRVVAIFHEKPYVGAAWQRLQSDGLLAGCLAGTLAGFTLVTRWQAFVAVWTQPLLPDAAGYLEIARGGSLWLPLQDHAPFLREPFFPAYLRAIQLLVDGGAPLARLAGIVPSVLLVLATFLVGWRVFSLLVGTIAASALAANPFLAVEAVSVLRDEWNGLLLVAVVGALALLPDRPYRRSLPAALLAGVWCSLRVGNLPTALIMLVYTSWRRGWGVREAIFTAAVAILPVLPFLAWSQAAFGDPFQVGKFHAQYYMNLLMVGEPGFPATEDEWEANPYVGDPVAPMMLMAERPGYGIPALVRGYAMVFLWEFPHGHLFFGQEWLMAFGLLGGVVFIRGWRRWGWLVPWFVLAMAPVAMIATIRMDYRLAIPAAPFILWVWALGIEEAGRIVYTMVGRWRRG